MVGDFCKKHLLTTANCEFHVETETVNGQAVAFCLQETDALTGESSVAYKSLPYLTVVDSVNSGTGRHEHRDFYSRVIKPVFDKLKIQHRILKTKDAASIKAFARTEFAVDLNHLVLFLSGDTTISEFINNLPPLTFNNAARYNLDIVPFPMGTGNAFAHSVGNHCPIDTLKYLLNSENLQPNPLPLYKACFPNGVSTVFFIILSFAFHANLLHACNDPKYAKLGAERFQLASKEILDNSIPHVPLVINDGKPNEYSYFILVNTPYLEGGYIPSPKSSIFDDKLHLLGYKAGLSKDNLVKKIRQGYSNQLGDDLIIDDHAIYQPIVGDALHLRVATDTVNLRSRSMYEICCDGILYNLLDMQSGNDKADGNITVQFLHNDYSAFQLQAFGIRT